MIRRLIRQSDLDTFWDAYDAGQRDEKRLAKLIRFSEPTIRDIIRTGRRIGPDCDLERRAEAVAAFRALMADGAKVYDAAKEVGLTTSDGLREYKIMQSESKAEPPDTLRPPHVTAEMYSDEWRAQQQRAFVRAMLKAHPELAGPLA
jgi:hypothetical protein